MTEQQKTPWKNKTLWIILAMAIIVFGGYALLNGCLKGNRQDTVLQNVADSTVTANAAGALAEYMTGVKAQSEAIKAALENEALTQTDMNEKSGELSELWNGALTRLLAEAQKSLSETEWTQLSAEQKAWEADTATAVEAAGKEFEGGSMHALVVNSEKARLTEERVDKLYELLK